MSNYTRTFYTRTPATMKAWALALLVALAHADDHAHAEAWPSPAAAVDDTSGAAQSSASPASFLCKVCGATLFETREHIPGLVLGGPRVVRALPGPPSLGPEGTLWELVRASGAPGSVATVLFSAGHSLILGAQAAASAFPGFVQRQAVCARCTNPVGWHFDSARSVPMTVTPQPLLGGPAVEATAAAVPGSVSGVISVVQHDEDKEVATLASLEGVCLLLPKGWWTFQWCHRKRVNQFHRESEGGVMSPDWSLGDFDDSGRLERTRSPWSASAGYYTSHFFTGGQRCDETGKGRSTEVQFFCCAHAKQAPPFIEDVEEQQMCKYRVRVCVPALCVTAGATPTPTPRIVRTSEWVPPSPELGEVALEDAPQTEASADPSADATSQSERGGPGPAPTRTPFPSPDPSFSPGALPSSFFAAAWPLLLSSQEEAYTAVGGGDMGTGIAPVRFA